LLQAIDSLTPDTYHLSPAIRHSPARGASKARWQQSEWSIAKIADERFYKPQPLALHFKAPEQRL
jgi:hypothetical protein